MKVAVCYKLARAMAVAVSLFALCAIGAEDNTDVVSQKNPAQLDASELRKGHFNMLGQKVKEMKRKKTEAEAANPPPYEGSYECIVDDWKEGRFEKVRDWAQTRLKANPDDLPAALVMVDYDTAFSDHNAISNSIIRMLRISDASKNPIYKEFHEPTKPGWKYYLDKFLPSLKESDRGKEQAKARRKGQRLTCDFLLEILDASGEW